jgi:class 3 adenylate cyclase
MANRGDGQVGLGDPSSEELPEGRRAPCLIYRDASGAQQQCVLEGGGPLTIGRAGGVDLCLAWDPSVSSVHAEVVRLSSHWLIGDDGLSRNGTFVNGERIKGRRRLRDGDIVRIGRTVLTFDDSSRARRGATTISDASEGSGTVTLLFTDLVGSTALLDRLGEEQAEGLRREHFAILRRAAAEHGGEEVKSLGDGLMLAFSSAAGAVACAASMQQRIAAQEAAEGGEALGLRIGLNAGEVIRAEDDYFGAPVVVAKRLCDQAAAGQTLLSDVVRALVASRCEYRLITRGALRLKGLADPVTAFELDWRARAEL